MAGSFKASGFGTLSYPLTQDQGVSDLSVSLAHPRRNYFVAVLLSLGLLLLVLWCAT
jgi:hypothetical protein